VVQTIIASGPLSGGQITLDLLLDRFPPSTRIRRPACRSSFSEADMKSRAIRALTPRPDRPR